MIELIKTGISGLDQILKGGLRRNSTILVTGAPGTGKTIMALQFIYYGAKKYNENGILIATEENLSDLRNYGKNFGMNFKDMEKKGKIFLVEKPLTMLKGGISSIKGMLDLIKKKNIKRVALDSIIFFEYLYPKHNNSSMEFRREVLLFMQKMKRAGVTFMTISERRITDLDRLEYEMMDFVFEGLIILSRVRKGSYFERVLTVEKIRGQDHSLDVYPVAIDKSGIRILHDQIPFSLVEKEEEKQGFK
ncbi:MAG: DEAD/DEAH box helicase family protein [Nanoarchaeota archaeon]|nr:DEAD/DEAH box helicase family protein [Nanoarchaeota archaeon]